MDDGVQSECGSCGPCERACAGPDETCRPFGDETPGLETTPEGFLVLEDVSSSDVWVPSYGTNVVLHVDSRTREILGAYHSGPFPGDGSGLPGSGDAPVAVAVDLRGDAMVLNQAGTFESRWASVTRFAARAEDCVDRDGDGLETSAGYGDVLPFESHDAWSDECILWHSVVDELPLVGQGRALAILETPGLDGTVAGRGWVGIELDHAFVEIDTETGERTGIEVPVGDAYFINDAVVDRDGKLWVAGNEGAIGLGLRLDTSRPDDGFERLPGPGGSFNFLLIDEDNAPWAAANDVYRWDRDEERWTGAGILKAGRDGLVATLVSDGQGSIWAGSRVHAFEERAWRISRPDIRFALRRP